MKLNVAEFITRNLDKRKDLKAEYRFAIDFGTVGILRWGSDGRRTYPSVLLVNFENTFV